MSVFLVRGYSLAGAIRSIYLFPVPTLLLHDRKEINVCFIFLWNYQDLGYVAKYFIKLNVAKLTDDFGFSAFPHIDFKQRL